MPLGACFTQAHDVAETLAGGQEGLVIVVAVVPVVPVVAAAGVQVGGVRRTRGGAGWRMMIPAREGGQAAAQQCGRSRPTPAGACDVVRGGAGGEQSLGVGG